MILESMHWLKPACNEEFDRLLEENRIDGRYKGIILTGAEVTLRKDLPDLAKRARLAGFQHVRIQTHGMRLANLSYCKSLLESGVDQFFISVTADDAAIHDSITGVPGSFDRTIQGLENLDQFSDVEVMTNTVITAKSYRSLPGVVLLLGHLRNLVQMDFWSYWPMSEEDDTDLLVSHLEVAPHLRAAIELANERGRLVEVKNFPHCLLGSEAYALRNDQPELKIDPRFWSEFEKNGFYQCIYRNACGSRQCLGLNSAYVKQFGWHESELTPFPRGFAPD
jgi:MoaA/NifB/PqqE/SkfB family radical SAM enzyme